VAYLLDTSILARLANAADAQHSLAVQAVMELHRRGEVLHTTPQVLIEFRSVSTRPQAANGLGLPSSEADAMVSQLESSFPLLGDSPDIFPAWKSLVERMGIVGKQVHDARLFAVCHVHSVTHLLTFNVAHFTRLAGPQPGILVVHPQDV
jgi:predicted nucleic acid-binding protein